MGKQLAARRLTEEIARQTAQNPLPQLAVMFKPSVAAKSGDFFHQHFDDRFLCVRENPARPIGPKGLDEQLAQCERQLLDSTGWQWQQLP
jgi:hypothetical protein